MELASCRSGKSIPSAKNYHGEVSFSAHSRARVYDVGLNYVYKGAFIKVYSCKNQSKQEESDWGSLHRSVRGHGVDVHERPVGRRRKQLNKNTPGRSNMKMEEICLPREKGLRAV